MGRVALALFALWAIFGSAHARPARGSPAHADYERGVAALGAGDRATAAAAFERAMASDPGDVDIRLKLGIAYSGLGRQDAALEQYGVILERQPRHVQALNNSGNVHFRKGEYELAEGYYRRAIEARPDYLIALFHLGWIRRHFNDPVAAEQAFRHCLRLDPRSGREQAMQHQARYYLGALRFRQRDWQEAAAWMEQVLAAEPEHLEAHYYLGQALLRLGRREEAERLLRRHAALVEARRPDEPVASGNRR